MEATITLIPRNSAFMYWEETDHLSHCLRATGRTDLSLNHQHQLTHYNTKTAMLYFEIKIRIIVYHADFFLNANTGM